MPAPKVAVITPYYLETDEILSRCLKSVAEQTHADVVHYCVADGHPNPLVDTFGAKIRHIKLPLTNRDNGCTPCSIGGIAALNEGADIVCYLDADNLFFNNHAQSVIDAFARQPVDVMYSNRFMFPRGYPDERVIHSEDLTRTHVDRSCYSVARSAAFLLPTWGMMPKVLSPICDRVFLTLIRYWGCTEGWTGDYTVLFDSNYAETFVSAGLPVPAGVHDIVQEKLRSRFTQEEAFARLRVPLFLRAQTERENDTKLP